MLTINEQVTNISVHGIEMNVESAGLRLYPEFTRDWGRSMRMIFKIKAIFFRASCVPDSVLDVPGK